MKSNINKYTWIGLLFPLFLLTTGCERDFVNPNAASEDQVLSSTDGLLAMINGMRYRYTVGGASGLYSYISANGLSSLELQILNAGNAELAQLGNGGNNVAPSNAVVSRLWENLNLLRADAEKVIANAPSVISDPGTRAGVLGSAYFYKGLALGSMAQFWTHGVTVTGDPATFASREQVLQEAVNQLGLASSTLSGVTLSGTFTSAVGNDIDLANAARALTARYETMLGNWGKAIDAASAVNLTSKSVFTFDNVSQNPVFRVSLITNNVYDVNPQFGLPAALAPDPNDGRIAFYITPKANNGKGFFTADDAPIPVYLPGEIMLILAEAYARQGGNDNLSRAVQEINKVRTKTNDIFGVNAGLGDYDGDVSQDAILLEIYRQRCMELYMSGLKLEDNRRFNRPGPGDPNAERNRNYYPFPNSESDNNPNTPANPPV